jgi:subtilisin-like proprotein convertase family protein
MTAATSSNSELAAPFDNSRNAEKPVRPENRVEPGGPESLEGHTQTKIQSNPNGTKEVFHSRSIADILDGADMTDPKVRAQVVQQVKHQELSSMQVVLDKADQLGVPVRVELPDGRIMELIGFNGDEPIYRTTQNLSAAISSGASLLRENPYGLSGNGIKVGVWDGGSVRSSHRELLGRTGLRNSSAQLSDHATHVAGTIGASGVRGSAEGMASAVQIDSYDWNSVLSEMLSAGAAAASGAGTVSISNHSYGMIVGYAYDGSNWLWYGDGTSSSDTEEDFGRYNSLTRDWDAVANQLPYLTIFKAAGNDRNDTPSSGSSVYSPLGSFLYSYSSTSRPGGDGDYRNGYECQAFAALAKNIITIGAVTDAVSGGSRLPDATLMSSFSCWGPTDDGRIKPDLVATGVDVESSVASSDTSYATYQGTSMATPSAAGSAALLVELYRSEFSMGYMPSSLMKALLIHAADDLGITGPDYKNGWGLINVYRAADLLLAHKASPSSPKIFEESLVSDSQTFTHEFDWDGSSPIRATLCWNDPPGVIRSQHDSRAPTLVHNLDLTVTAPNGQVFQPYVMPFVGNWTAGSMALAAINGKNNVDNVEQVYLSAPSQAGRYSVTVSLDGPLTKSQQLFSLIVTGSQSTGSDESRTLRLSGDLAYGAVEVGQAATRSLLIENLGNSALTVTGISLPAGYSGNWSGVLASGASQSVSIQFSPTGTGAYNGSLRVSSDATTGMNTVALSGSGVAANTIGTLVNGQLISGLSGATNSVRYYQLNVPSGQSTLSFEMTGAGDADMYVRLGNLPTVNDWDYRPYSGGSDETVTINGAQAGAWYIMIRGYSSYSGLALKATYEGSATVSRIIELQGELDFGNIPVGDSVTRNLIVRNLGTSALSVTGLSLPSGFSGNWVGFIAPGSQQQIAITFSPTAEQVYLDDAVVSSDKTSGDNTMSMSGTGVITQIALQNGVLVGPFSGLQASTSFFFIDVPADQSSLNIQLEGGSGSADVYVQYGARPSLSGYDYRTNDVGSDDTLSIPSPQEGRWFILLYAESQFTDVRLSAEYGTAVVNTRTIRLTGNLDFGEVRVNDSGLRELVIHNDGNVPLTVTEIQFTSGFSGSWSGIIQPGDSRSATIRFQPIAEGVNTGSVTVVSNATDGISTATMRGAGIADDASLDLDNGVPLSGLDGQVDSERRFQIEVPANATLLSVTISGGDGDADLYLRHGTPPTLSDYDFRPYLSGSDESVTVQSPASGVWYILLHGYADYSGLRIRASYTVGGSSQADFSNHASILLSDSGVGAPYPSTINVSGLGGAIKSVKTVLHGISHTFPADLDILLVGPGGESVILISDAGGSNDLVDVTLGFDDDSAQVLPPSSQLVTGLYRPTNYSSGDVFPRPAPISEYGLALDVFSETDPNGTWSLYVFDDAEGDSGSIADGWTLVIETQPSATLPPNLTDGSGTHVLTPSEVVRGETMDFMVDVANTGGTPSGAFTVRLQLSADDAFTAADTTVAEVNMTSINPGQLAQLNTTFTVPSLLTQGSYYLGWQIDALDEVLESDEEDNSWYRTVPIPVTGGATPIDDAYEENDTMYDAYLLNADGQWLSDLTGFGIQADEDWYAFSAYAGASVVIDCQFTHAEGDIDIELLDPSGNRVDNSVSTSDDEQLSSVLPSAGIYYIRVYFADAGNPYDLRWQITSSGLAPASASILEKLPGEAFNGNEFLTETRFSWQGNFGNWTYDRLSADVGRILQTYDVYLNDPEIYLEETILTFSSAASGSYVSRGYYLNALDYEESGSFDFPWLAASGPPVWEPQGWVYVTWPYAYATADGTWRFFAASGNQLRVDLSTGIWGPFNQSSGWQYFSWPYTYSINDSTWYWHNARATQWVVDLVTGVWVQLGPDSE